MSEKRKPARAKGGVYRRKTSPFWQYDFRRKGIRFSGSTRTTTEREARQFVRTLKAEIDAGAASRETKPHITMNVAAARYYDERGQFLSDARDIDRNLKRLVEFFGPNTPLADAANGDAPKQLAELVARRRCETVKGTGRPVSNRTVNLDVVDSFSRLVKYARKAWKLQRAIDAPEFSHLRLPETQERDRALTAEESDKLVAAIRADYLPLFAFARATGIRLTNLVTLTWPQVDFDRRRIRVKVKDRNAKDRWHTVPLTDPAIAILSGERNHHESRIFTFIRQRGPKKDQRAPVTAAGLRQVWDKARADAGVPDLRWHDLRHDFATTLLRNANRSNLKTVQRALGHKSLAATRRYAHVSDDDVAAAMNEAANNAQTPVKLPQNMPSAYKNLVKSKGK